LKYKEMFSFFEILSAEFMRKVAASLLNTSSFSQIPSVPGIASRQKSLQAASCHRIYPARVQGGSNETVT
jgi:hypothetical protein